MKTNTRRHVQARTEEGAPAISTSPIQDLRRAVLSCMLWEKSFYEDGVAIAERITQLVPQVPAVMVSGLAIQARSAYHIRHASLLLARELARHPQLPERVLVGRTITTVIQRADELAEFIALYKATNDGKRPIPRQILRGVAAAFAKFDAYQFGKYHGYGNTVTLRDALFLSHAKPENEARAALYKQIAERTLPVPDTWETQLSAGADKKATFERLLAERRLGYMALLRNLRKMDAVGVSADLIAAAILEGAARSPALPFRFIAAARAAPRFEGALDEAMTAAVGGFVKLPGKTTVLVDVSGSMMDRLSAESDLRRLDAACGLAIAARELCRECRVFAFSELTAEVPARRGMGLADAIAESMTHSGTHLGEAVKHVNAIGYERLIVITDEQSETPVGAPLPGSRAYMVNVAPSRRSVGYGAWMRLEGFSEHLLSYIDATEAQS